MILRLMDVSKNFGGVKALNKVNFDVEEKKITAIIGPNGSGKSTLFNVISGLYEIDNGRIYFKKRLLNGMSDFERARLGISRTFQEVRLFKDLTIKEHLEIAISREDERMIKSIFTLEIAKEKKIEELVREVGIEKDLNCYASDLSYGQRKLLDLAVGIAKEHKLLMLDEPVAGINPELRKKIKEILKNLKEQGETILLIEHDMNFVMDIADYVYVLDYGKLIAEGKPKEIQKNKKVLEAYLGS
jgi:branched-chain amino acid transport system ATP-binding protein